MLRRLNIRDKLLLVLWGTALFASVLAGGAAVVYHWLSIEHRAREVMEPYARMVAVGAESAVAFQDPVRAQEVLSGLSADPMILEAVIVLENGSVLARFSRQPGTPPSAVPPGREGVTVHQDTAELESGLPHGARLHLVMELSQLEAASRQTLWLFSVAAAMRARASGPSRARTGRGCPSTCR